MNQIDKLQDRKIRLLLYYYYYYCCCYYYYYYHYHYSYTRINVFLINNT